ncbi:histidine kinase [candidate division LCP-89 bacterium B3_LCP]|uniref:histidine kinase n=1 Tax=candidate division LCP-89 bacterium B3_LCP TaxID=2012998 RepID=A0A532UQW3_UNCL8|nr:MAG: histidine kinase [candidate division LCP-89 bacterium B3_LCP]
MDLPYKEYFDAIPGYLTVQNRDLKIITANDRFRQDFGDHEGRYCYQVYKQRPEQCEICPVMRTFHDGQRHRSEEQVTCLDGTVVSVLVYTKPIRNEKGEITEVLEMSTDITEIKALQEQIRISQKKYRTLFEEVPCYISMQDKELNIFDSNKAFKEKFDTALGKKCYEVYKRRKNECFPCMVQDTFRDGRQRVHEEVVTSDDGQPLNVLVHTTPIRNVEGDIISVMEMSADITRIRDLQSQLTSIGLLISSISHGLKGLINGLDGGIYLVNYGLKKDNQERVEKGWEIVLRNVGRIRSMVLDILYYAKDREPNWEKLSATNVLEEIFSVIDTKAQEQGIKLQRDIDLEVADFDADEQAIRTLLINLAENSLDACRLDKKKEDHQVQLSLRGDMDHVRFEIEDNGIGMDNETREKAFSLFFSSKGGEGTGLGLFISNKIAQAHGGSITLDSEPGKGTRFIVSLPRNRPMEAKEDGGEANAEKKV